jgi:TPP-dependent pyruvate/acetoin dehydrogenase alpha subunit
VEARRAAEPLARCRALLGAAGVKDAALAEIEARERSEVDAAFEFAAQSPWPEPEAAFQHMFA